MKGPEIKKRIVSIIILTTVLTTVPAFAKIEGISIGFKAGATFSDIQGDLLDDLEGSMGVTGPLMMVGYMSNVKEKLKTGAHAAFSINFHLQPWFTIETGLGYSQRGLDFSSDVTMYPYPGLGFFGISSVRVKSKINMDYIEIPVLCRFKIRNSSPVTPVILLGPAFAFNVNSKMEVQAEGGGESSENLQDATREIDLDIVAGAGLNFDTGSGTLHIEGRYTYGLTNIDEADENDMYHSVMTALIGYTW